eukprot:CAMPEP_0113846396 /NCGR_PEP_ID=MMETSP0372-20130328/1284_1 /TAXON_ID=340204 /ORGANISM="Lankesteria abbotti" /LENGTH=271 /DNA_ID=CAMNT_0000815535 /DNA_START=42 /DNA_END=854 /DNA_ORIENTATION=+ /assembly_acc=CAM_ASM_000359
MAQELSPSLKKWFPFGKVFGGSSLRVVCFHSAGSDSAVFANKGTKAKPMPNNLIDFCVENKIDFLPVHLPGRTMRLKEQLMFSAESVASAVVDVLQTGALLSRTTDVETVNVCVIGHSMGCWCALEFLKLLKLNKQVNVACTFLSCMVAPGVGKDQRLWREVVDLENDADLQSECRGWNANEALFEEEMWRMYAPIMRADLTILDVGGRVSCGSTEALTKRLVTFDAAEDCRISDEAMRGWKEELNCVDAKHVTISGNHSFVYDAAARDVW